MGSPLPRLLMYLLDASIDAECLELSKKLLSLGADPSWAQGRVQKYKEGVSQRDRNRKRVEEFPDEPESPLSAKLPDEPDFSTDDPTGKFFQELAPLLRRTAANERVTDSFASGIDFARDQNPPEAPPAPHQSPLAMPVTHRRHSSTDSNGINWTSPQPPDWKNAELPVLEAKWVTDNLPKGAFCVYAPRCNHGFDCKFVHRVRCCANFEPRMNCSDFPLAEEVFRRGVEVAYRTNQGHQFWTAKFVWRPFVRPSEMYFSEGGDCRTNHQGIAWYRSEDEAVAALRDRTRLYRNVQQQFKPPRWWKPK